MAYKVIILYQLYMPSYFLGTFTEYPYLRCKNIQLGYTLPRHISEKFFVENLKIYTSIDNLFTLTDFPGLDPEIAAGVGYPQLRQYSVGINVTF